jgi:hypothetical protein
MNAEAVRSLAEKFKYLPPDQAAPSAEAIRAEIGSARAERRVRRTDRR